MTTDTSSAVVQLLIERRQSMRPRWSQAFLADELTRLGFTTSRGAIARLERAQPHEVNLDLAGAASLALRIPRHQFIAALTRDTNVRIHQISQQMGLSGLHNDITGHLSASHEWWPPVGQPDGPG